MDVEHQGGDDQAKLWNPVAGCAWVEAQDTIDQMFKPIEDLLVDVVLAGSPHRVLDVGCGTGATTVAVARRLGLNGECVGVGYSVALQLGSPALHHLVGELVDGGLDAAAGHRARDRAVGCDDHGGAGWTRRGLDRADDGGDARRSAGTPDREQLVEYIAHGPKSMPESQSDCASAQR